MVTLSEEVFGTFENEPVKRFTWKTPSGFTLSAISYGVIIQNIRVPDKNGKLADLVLGFDDLESYVKRNDLYLGAVVGRCANRLSGAKFTLDGKTYNLAKNMGDNHIHGGVRAFNKVNWQSTVKGTKVVFSYLSKDGEEGYPGDLLTNITYEVRDDDSLYMEYQATTTKKTIVNLSNHSYFNLAGHEAGAKELFNHVVTINADKIIEKRSEDFFDTMPTGKFINIAGTKYNLRVPTNIGDAMRKDPILYDENYCICTFGNKGLNFVSRVEHPPSGRYLDISSNQPGVQFYSGLFLPGPSDPPLVGKANVGYRRHGAFCLETQNYPDAINHDSFPSPVLVPGDVYTHEVVYKFGLIK